MLFNIPSNKLPFTAIVGIDTKPPQKINIIAKDRSKPNTYYISRCGAVNGRREFILKFPQSANVTEIRVWNPQNGYSEKPDPTFNLSKFDVKHIQTCPVWMNKDTEEFIEFIKKFCENASILSAGAVKPSTYRSKSGKFVIDFYDTIYDKRTGKYLSTPARIGHSSGVIEVAKSAFDKYTVPMRMVILLHEYSHKWMNPVGGRDISDEVSADLNALNLYLSMGYPTLEAQYAFLKVFRGANNEFNAHRYKILDRFIKDFTSGKLNGCSSEKGLAKK